MVYAEVSWEAVALAAVPGALGLLGVLMATLIAARTRRRELTQERVLHGEEARLQALDAAAVTAIDYRERVAAALSIVAHSDRPRIGVDPLWAWERTEVMDFLRHDAALALRFGRTHEVPGSWRAYAWKLAEATEFAKVQKHWGEQPAKKVPVEIREKAKALRRATRLELEAFLEIASTPVKQISGE
jgi:hypothetical protein